MYDTSQALADPQALHMQLASVEHPVMGLFRTVRSPGVTGGEVRRRRCSAAQRRSAPPSRPRVPSEGRRSGSSLKLGDAATPTRARGARRVLVGASRSRNRSGQRAGRRADQDGRPSPRHHHRHDQPHRRRDARQSPGRRSSSTTGRAGGVGSDQVAKAPGDGKTLVMGTIGTHAIMPPVQAALRHAARLRAGRVRRLHADALVVADSPIRTLKTDRGPRAPKA